MEICVGMIGAGYAARLHAAAYQKVSGVSIHLKYITDLDRSKAEQFQQLSGCQLVADSWEEILQDPQVDVVDLCTPPNTHLELAEQAFQAGKHVICEKPLTGYFGKTGDPAPVGTFVPKGQMLAEVVSSLEHLLMCDKEVIEV